MEQFIAIDNACGWPNMCVLPDGTLLAIIFNQPSHGRTEGSVDCYASTDEGRSWTLRGTPAPHEPGTNRMNVAAGVTPTGAVVVLCSGWRDPAAEDRGGMLPTWNCRSTDGGLTWMHTEDVAIEGNQDFVPFGDIITLSDGRLAACAYRHNDNWMIFSRDDGRTWNEATPIAEGFNETTPLLLESGRIIAAARSWKPVDNPPIAKRAIDQHLELHISDDMGASWRRDSDLSLPGQHPGALTHLPDGRLLLTYGMRNPGYRGIAARIGRADGEVWSAPTHVIQWQSGDGGYPSSRIMPDGTIVTIYYASRSSSHHRYHVGAVRWTLADFNLE